MDGRELRRSYTQLEFPVTSRVVRPQHHSHYQQVRPLGKRYQQQMASTATRAKFPTMEIYRPPNMRDSSTTNKTGDPNAGGGKLNVYAKEFVMSAPLQPSKSTGSILSAVEDSAKQNSKSILHNMNRTSHQIHAHQQQHQTRGVQWIDECNRTTNSSIHNSINSPTGRDLKRSKSTGSSIHTVVTSALTSTSIPLAQELALFDGHSAERLVKKASSNIDLLSVEELMELPKLILEKALEDRAHAQSYATISMSIIERDKRGTFLESLLNICQYTCERKKTQKGGGGDHGSKYHSFMAFLNELYSQMKPKHSQLKLCTGSSPTHTVLSLIVQVCQAVLSQKNLTARPEIECLFFTVTTVGRDLELDDPRLLDSLMWAVRDAFLASGTSQPNKQTLLQLIELKAAKWHLPASTIMYYKNHAQI